MLFTFCGDSFFVRKERISNVTRRSKVHGHFAGLGRASCRRKNILPEQEGTKEATNGGEEGRRGKKKDGKSKVKDGVLGIVSITMMMTLGFSLGSGQN